MCIACQGLGYSPRDITTYQCEGGHGLGHLRFDRMTLKDSKRRGTVLMCTACKDRVKGTLNLLRMADSWRCRCKKIAVGQKAHAALYAKTHQPRCPLTPTCAKEERWDGKNNGVAKEDLLLLARIGKY